MFNRLGLVLAIVAATLGASATAAFAQQAQTPTISGNAWVAIAILIGLVVFIALLIGGVLSVSKRGETANPEGGGFPILEDEEDRPKRRR